MRESWTSSECPDGKAVMKGWEWLLRRSARDLLGCGPVRSAQRCQTHLVRLSVYLLREALRTLDDGREVKMGSRSFTSDLRCSSCFWGGRVASDSRREGLPSG